MAVGDTFQSRYPMNTQVTREYAQYLAHTGDSTAAGCLVLAAALRECRPVPRADQPFTVPEVAKFLRVRPDKVLSWIRSGRLRGFNVAEKENGRPKYRVSPEELEAFANRRMPYQPPPKGRPPGHRRFPPLPSKWPSL
jgi:excisionase family DNA binding protein